MNNQGQGVRSNLNRVLYFLCLYLAKTSGERLQDHWTSGFVVVVVLLVAAVVVVMLLLLLLLFYCLFRTKPRLGGYGGRR